MSDESIERSLKKAPRPPVPFGLLERLQADISLPHVPSNPAPSRSPVPWFRRWMPALSFGVFLFGCAILIAMQSVTIAQLQTDNQAQTDPTRNGETRRPRNPTPQSPGLKTQELERLRKENLELQKLRIEVTQLREQATLLDQLRAENKRLLGELESSRALAGGDALDSARAKAESIRCINNLKQIGLAARIFASDNSDANPPDILSMKNELSTPKILVCPADVSRTEAANWSEFGSANMSYEMYSPGLKQAYSDPSVILFRCPIHGHVCLADGSVQQLPKEGGAQIVVKDGKHVLVRGQPPTQP